MENERIFDMVNQARLTLTGAGNRFEKQSRFGKTAGDLYVFGFVLFVLFCFVCFMFLVSAKTKTKEKKRKESNGNPSTPILTCQVHRKHTVSTRDDVQHILKLSCVSCFNTHMHGQ